MVVSSWSFTASFLSTFVGVNRIRNLLEIHLWFRAMLRPSRLLKLSPYHEIRQGNFLKSFMCSLKLHSEFLSQTCSLNLPVWLPGPRGLVFSLSYFFSKIKKIFGVCYEGVGACMWAQVWGHTGGGERTGFHPSCPVHISVLKNSISQWPRICQVR